MFWWPMIVSVDLLIEAILWEYSLEFKRSLHLRASVRTYLATPQLKFVKCKAGRNRESSDREVIIP